LAAFIKNISDAVYHNDLGRLRALLEAGGNPNEAETAEDNPPLITAAYHDQVEAARLLLDAGADMYARHSGGETPLLVAGQCGNQGVFWLLVERGYQLDLERDNVAWMFIEAAGHGAIEIVRWLLAQGVNVDATDFGGRTALIRAAHRDHLEVVEELLRAGADPDHRDDDTETVLMWAADHAGNAAVLRALLQAGAHVNLKNDVEHTALSWAMRDGDLEMVKVLLDAGADVNGVGVLIWAAYYGDAPATRLLLERGVDIRRIVNDDGTALDVARKRGHRDVVNLLKQAEIDLRLLEAGGAYPQHYPIGTRVRTRTGTPREGWILLAEWHFKREEYFYTIEVEGQSKPRKTVSNRYWQEDLEIIADDRN
jgi:ankyrin repeat protein